MMFTRSITLLTVLLMPILLGCAQQSSHAPEQTATRPANRYIYVTNQNIPGQCYTDLGPVNFVETFAQSAVDPDQSEAAKRLRAAARAAYPGNVDAVINVNSQQNDVGTQVTFSGEAIRLEDHTTAQCALRGSKGAIDTAAMIGAGGIGGAVGGGLVGGAGLAAAAGLGGASAAAAKQVLEHRAASDQQQEEFSKTLADQRREITRLLKERAQLRKCQEQEIKLDNCLSLISRNARSAPAAEQQSPEQESNASAGQPTTDASPFEVQRHLQEQRDYINGLKHEIARIKWQMGGL